MNSSKQRQSCPAQFSSSLLQQQSSNILGDSTNMRRSLANNSKNIFSTYQKDSVSSRLSEPVYPSGSFSEIKNPSIASKGGLFKNSIMKNDIIEEEEQITTGSYSKMRNNPSLKSSQISQRQSSQIREEQYSSQSSQISQNSRVSSDYFYSQDTRELSPTNYNKKNDDKNTLEQISDTTTLVSNSKLINAKSNSSKAMNVLSKLIILAAISFFVFAMIIGGKMFYAKTMNSSGFSDSYIQEQQLKNQYFSSQILDETTPRIKKDAVLPKNDNVESQKSEDSEEEWYIGGQKDIQQGQEEILKNQNVSEDKQYQQGRTSESNNEKPKRDNINQSNQNYQEMLIKDEATQFYNHLVKAVQKDNKISYSSFHDFLVENCTQVYLEKIKEIIQNMVNESLSITEELNIETGIRYYISQEKYY